MIHISFRAEWLCIQTEDGTDSQNWKVKILILYKNSFASDSFSGFSVNIRFFKTQVHKNRPRVDDWCITVHHTQACMYVVISRKKKEEVRTDGGV